MPTFAYRHWDSELVFAGDWAEGEGGSADGGASLATRLRALHDALWSDSPPGLRADADVAALTALGDLDHPLARALLLMYHAVGQRFARPTSRGRSPAENDLLRRAARRVLQEPPIAHGEAAVVARLLDSLQPADCAYLRWTALAALRELAQAADANLLLGRLGPSEPGGRDAGAVDRCESTDSVDERVEAVLALPDGRCTYRARAPQCSHLLNRQQGSRRSWRGRRRSPFMVTNRRPMRRSYWLYTVGLRAPRGSARCLPS